MNDELYAVTESGYRAVTADMELLPGEQLSSSVPEEVLVSIRAKQMKVDITQRLRGTDWTQAPDGDMAVTQRQQWADYRQALRELPLAEGFPDCAWPEEPSE